jgi:hypothetical protein
MSRPARSASRTARRALLAGGVLAALVAPATAAAADPVSLGIVLTNDRLATFDPASPGSLSAPVAVTGLASGDTLVGIDVRPQNGQLYGLGRNATDGTIRLYALSARTGEATAIGGATAVAGTTFGFDFNPKVDRIRVVSEAGKNLRLDPNTGAVAGTDGDISGATTKVDGAAYTNNEPNTTATTLYTLSGSDGKLFLQAPPNAGTQTAAKPVTFAGLPLGFSDVGGFDIAPGVDAPSDDAAAPAGSTGFASMTALGLPFLTKVDLGTGSATPVGVIGDGTRPVQGLAIQQETKAGGLPALSVTADTTTTSKLRRFDTTTPGTGTEVTITGLQAGELPVGVDWRPQTGQLLLLGVDADKDTGSLYRVDPQSGAATVIGAAGSVAFRTTTGDAVDLPPVATGYDIDVNPTVDRVRVVAGNTLNFRLNPTVADGASVAVDGNNGGTEAVEGVNTDGVQNGEATDVTGTAYTNSFGQPVPTPPAAATGVTTQYGLSAEKNAHLIQNPPNTGRQTAPQGLKVGGTALDVTSVRGFDIPASVKVTSGNAAATGSGLAVLGSAGQAAGLYAIDLASGNATLQGALPAAPTSFATGDGPAAFVPQPGTGTSTTPPTTPPAATPAGPNPPAAKAGFARSTKLTVKLRSTRVSRNGPAKVTFRNTNRFAVKVRLQATTPKSGRRKAIRYATKTYTVKASSSRTVNLRLPAAARKELRTKRKLTIRATLRVTAPDGTNRTVRKTLSARRR